MSEPHPFFNVIRFPEGLEVEALEAWTVIGEFMERQAGFIGSTLYRNRRDPLMYINHGRYESEAAFVACVRSPEFGALSERLAHLGVERVAGLYDVVRSFKAGGA